MMHVQTLSISYFKNEEERDENEDKHTNSSTTITNSKFDMKEKSDDGSETIDQNNRPNDLPNLSSNHIISSPVTSNSNAVWNTDTWTDGEFEPIEESTLGLCHDLIFSFSAVKCNNLNFLFVM